MYVYLLCVARDAYTVRQQKYDYTCLGVTRAIYIVQKQIYTYACDSDVYVIYVARKYMCFVIVTHPSSL